MKLSKFSKLAAPSNILYPPEKLSKNSDHPAFINLSSSSRGQMRQMSHLLASPPKFKNMGQYVGELQEKWQFPSDHLPIGMSLDGNHIMSWNVLDSMYMDWVIKKDSQGLNRSLLAEEHVYIDGTDLTVRDMHVMRLILEALKHPRYPKNIFNLQEVSSKFIEQLKTQLPENMVILGKNGNAIIINTDHFEVLESRNIYNIFSQDPRPIQIGLLKNKATGELLKLFNVHLPGDPKGPARFEFSKYLANQYDPEIITIATGDMNFNEIEMKEAMQQSGHPNYIMYSPYCTNISPKGAEDELSSKCIDHFIIQGDALGRVECLMNPDDVIIGTKETAELLTSFLTRSKGRT